MKKIDFELAKVLSLTFLFAISIVCGILFIARLILYIRATQQQCFPDVTFAEFTWVVPLLIVTILIPTIVFVGTVIISYLSQLNLPKIKLPEKVILTTMKFKSNIHISEKAVDKIAIGGKWFMYLYFAFLVMMLILLIGNAIYILFFDDPCQFVN